MQVLRSLQWICLLDNFLYSWMRWIELVLRLSGWYWYGGNEVIVVEVKGEGLWCEVQ